MTPPPLDEAARRLLRAVDGLPVRMPERERLVRALDLIASDEWSRVTLRLPAGQLDGLRRAALLFAPNELSHVLGVARWVAEGYRFEHIGIAHIAVALALTARYRNDVIAEMVEVVAEAFGLGTLIDPFKVRDRYLLVRENGGEVDADLYPGIYLAPEGQRVQTIASAMHIGLRIAAAVTIGVVAVRHGSPWLWLLAVGALVASRDSRETPLRLGEPAIGPLQVRLRWPLAGGLVVVAALLGDTFIAWLVLTLLLATETVAYVGEAVRARYHRYFGDQVEGLGANFARIASLPETFATRARCARVTVVVWSGAAVAVLTGQPLYALATVLVARRLSGAAAVCLACALVLGGQPWPGLVAVLIGALARALIAFSDRPVRAVLPISPLSTKGIRARWLLSRDRASAALRYLDGADTPYLFALRGWALLQTGQPGDAKAQAQALPDGWAAVRGLIVALAELDLGKHDRARGALESLPKPIGDRRWQRQFRAYHAIAELTAMETSHTDEAHAALLAVALPPANRVVRSNLLHVVALMRLIAARLVKAAPAASSSASDAAFLCLRWARHGRSIRWFGFLGTERRLDLEIARCAALSTIAEVRLGQADIETITQLGSDTGAAGVMLRLDRPLEAAAVLNSLADALDGTPQRLTALDSRVDALAVLHWARHRMSDLEDRRLWWGTAERTLENALRQAMEGQDWALLAELIESARLQFHPDQDPARVGVAPFIRVRGISRLESSAWYETDIRPPTYNLEDMAAAVRGPGTWWWSTWSADDRLYWALVPPSGDVRGGFLSLADGSSVRHALAELRDALPVPYPGEVAGSDVFNERVEQGALCGPLHAEQALARRLGALLPPPLRVRLRDRDRPLPLAIAPAHGLANVPWSLVGLPDEPGDLRLVERARFVVAPPAALLASVASRARHHDSRLRLAVLNPGGAHAALQHRLPAADRLADDLPSGITTIGASDLLDIRGFGEVLRGLPAGSSAVFACHTHPGDGRPLSSGLLIRPGLDPVVLTARHLITEPDTHPIPEQVLVLACESADLRQAASGEWLVLGPALLWAGARRLVVTSYPIPDDDVVDRGLIQVLVDGTDLADGLRSVQVERLHRWRDTEGLDALPITWGGHVTLGSFGEADLRVVTSPPERLVHRTVAELVDRSARDALLRGHRVVTFADVFEYLVHFGYIDDLPARRKHVAKAVAFAWSLPARLRSVRKEPAGTVNLAPDVVQLLRAATDIAATARHRVLHIEHVLAATLVQRGARSAIARLMTGWDGRHPEVVKELIGETQANLQFVELPTLRYLSAPAVTDLYAACSAQVPEPGELQRLISEL